MKKNHVYAFHQNKISVIREKIIKNDKYCINPKLCNDGMILNANGEFQRCSCMNRFLTVRDRILAGLPKSLWFKDPARMRKQVSVTHLLTSRETTATKLKNRVIKNIALIKEGRFGMFILGRPGVGKTTFGTSVIVKAIDNNIESYYIYFKDLIDLKIQGFSDPVYKSLYNEITHTEFLIIDELSLVSRVTPHMVSEFTSLCKQRYENLKTTFILSNFDSLHEIQENFGSPLASLLCEAFMPLKFKSKDLRTHDGELLKQFFQ